MLLPPRAKRAKLLDISGLGTFYGDVPVLKDVSALVKQGDIVAFVGPNGAGKTTLFQAIAGLIRPVDGRIVFRGQEVQTLSVNDLVKLGIVYIPEGFRVFKEMSVRENLEVGAYLHRDRLKRNLESIFNLFPVLAVRQGEDAKNLSGGQQRMLTLARGLMAEASLLLLDDSFLGLAPKDTDHLCGALRKVRSCEVTLLLAGQHVKRVLSVADYAYLMEEGRVGLEGDPVDLFNHPHLKQTLYGRSE